MRNGQASFEELNARWDYMVTELTGPYADIRILLMDYDTLTKDDLIGTVVIPVLSLVPTRGEEQTLWFDVLKFKGKHLKSRTRPTSPLGRMQVRFRRQHHSIRRSNSVLIRWNSLALLPHPPAALAPANQPPRSKSFLVSVARRIAVVRLHTRVLNSLLSRAWVGMTYGWVGAGEGELDDERTLPQSALLLGPLPGQHHHAHRGASHAEEEN
jgi:hypothetical protein